MPATALDASSSRMQSKRVVEREMSRYQRGLVDTCFEEGQFEAAITALDQLRSPKYMPAASHIRQLLYMALYPPGDGIKENSESIPYPTSPRKAAKQQRSPLFPSPAATAASQRLLMSLARTNSPDALFRALPCSLGNDHSLITAATGLGDEEEFSVIAREAMCIKESKNCWTILEEGFIRRKNSAGIANTNADAYTTTSRGRGACNHLGKNEYADSDYGENADDKELPCVVAENGWPVLDWMIVVFELDEHEQVKNGFPRYSPILLSQIPSPRSGTSSRREVDAPLDIVFHCLKQTELRRKMYGARLLTLLVNLTSTIHLDLAWFITSVYTRLSSFELTSLLSVLAPSKAIIQFKVALCQKYITNAAAAPAKESRPKPQARAQPRKGRIESRKEETDAAAQITSKYFVLPSSEILRLVELNPAHLDDVGEFLRAKFELLVAFGILQGEMPEGEKDVEWAKMQQDGKLTRALGIAFGRDGELGQTYKEILLGLFRDCIHV